MHILHPVDLRSVVEKINIDQIILTHEVQKTNNSRRISIKTYNIEQVNWKEKNRTRPRPIYPHNKRDHREIIIEYSSNLAHHKINFTVKLQRKMINWRREKNANQGG